MPEAQPHTATPPDLTGRTLGDFHVLRRIGAGGMGQVYLARQMSLKREVALKLLRGELSDNPTALARFQAEAQAVAKLNHPNIVHIHQIGEADGLRYMVLEFVDGRNLRDYLARKGPPDLPIALSVIRQVAMALQKAHDQGIVHRDIKPENILVTRKVEVKVTDFGLSRFFTPDAQPLNLTQSGVTLGTPLYMSPEQVQGQTLDHRSDLYSFGVSCYHLLAGEPPFRGSSAFEVALKHVQEQPRQLADLRPDLPPALCAMVHKMMAKDREQRYQSARDIVRDLLKLREGMQAVTGQLSLTQTTPAANTRLTAPSEPLSLPDSDEVQAVRPGDERHARWRRILLAAFGCLLATGTGAALYAAVHRSSKGPVNEPSTPLTGLPAVPLPEKPTTTRERELLAVLNTEGSRHDEVIRASIELGLLYVREQRLAEATERFNRLKGKAADWRDIQAARLASITGRLGRAVVLAHENRPEASNRAFLDVFGEQRPKFDRIGANANWAMLRFPDLSQAISEALNRNAANLGKDKLEPPLEQFRSLRRAGKNE